MMHKSSMTPFSDPKSSMTSFPFPPFPFPNSTPRQTSRENTEASQHAVKAPILMARSDFLAIRLPKENSARMN